MATYKKEQEKSPSAHTLYNLYEEARVISNQKTLVARRVIQRDLRARLSLPGTLIDDYVRVIDERCASSTHQKVWRRRPNASRMDTMINQALNLAIKRALPRSIPKGKLRATAKVPCTPAYFNRVWYGNGDVNRTITTGAEAKLVRFTSGDIVGRIGKILGKLWGQRKYHPWKGSRTQCSYVDVRPLNPRKNYVTVTCRVESVTEPIGKREQLATPCHFIIINFPIDAC